MSMKRTVDSMLFLAENEERYECIEELLDREERYQLQLNKMDEIRLVEERET